MALFWDYKCYILRRGENVLGRFWNYKLDVLSWKGKLIELVLELQRIIKCLLMK